MSELTSRPPANLGKSDYYAWALAQPRGRFELYAGEVLAMAPERVRHAQAKGRAYRVLGDAIARAGVACEALPDGVSVEVDDHNVFEPDAVVNCGALDPEGLAAPTPVVIVEITSPSNSRVDLAVKFGEYFRLPSLRHYIIVQLAQRRVLHHRRTDDGRIETAILGSGPLALDPPGITILAEELLGQA